MIKQTVIKILLIAPLLLGIIIAGDWVFQSKKINKNFTDADGIELIFGSGRIRVHVLEKQIDEITQYTIKMDTPENGMSREWSFAVDRDMYGGGLVAAVDLYKDGMQGILAWGMHEEKQSFYIDTSTKKIEVRSYDQLPPDFKILLHKWHKINIMEPIKLSLFAIALVFYYLTAVVIMASLWFFKRMKRKNC